jgi:hypothetical protein
VSGTAGQHREIIQNFVDAILDGVPLIAPAAEGIHSVELANAMLYSAWTDTTVDLPLDGGAYELALRQKIDDSTYQKVVQEEVFVDLSRSMGI